MNFNLCAKVFNTIPAIIIQIKIIPGIIYLNEFGKNEKYFLYGLSLSKNGYNIKIKKLKNLFYIYITPTSEIYVYNCSYAK